MPDAPVTSAVMTDWPLARDKRPCGGVRMPSSASDWPMEIAVGTAGPPEALAMKVLPETALNGVGAAKLAPPAPFAVSTSPEAPELMPRTDKVFAAHEGSAPAPPLIRMKPEAPDATVEYALAPCAS